MGDQELNEGYTDEELEVLGEKPEVEQSEDAGTEKEPGHPESDGAEGDGSAEDKPEVEIEGQGDGDDDKRDTNAEKRINELFGKNKEYEERLNLLRTDPEAYYEKYPDERPEQDNAIKTGETSSNDPAAITVEGGPYDGKTFRQVYEIDPDAAWAIAKDAGEERLYYRLEGQIESERRDAMAQEQNAQRQAEERADRDISDFMSARSMELFDKPAKDLSQEQKAQVDSLIDDVTKWQLEQAENGNFVTRLDHAYLIMNQDKIAAKGKASQAIVDKAKGAQTPSAHHSGGEKVESGYEAMMNMTQSELAAKINGMSEAKQDDFYANAPEDLKRKYPGLPWD